MKFASLLFAAAASLAQADNDPSFDHQQKTYTASFEPVSAQNLDMSLTPFFSPDHSIDTLVDLINGAKTSIDIETPGVGSWSGCSSGSTCIGCSVENMNAEEFPVFPALLNAVHRGVTVRLITNNYNDVVCDGEIDMLNFWALNGIQVKWYQVQRVLCSSVGDMSFPVASSHYTYRYSNVSVTFHVAFSQPPSSTPSTQCSMALLRLFHLSTGVSIALPTTVKRESYSATLQEPAATPHSSSCSLCLSWIGPTAVLLMSMIITAKPTWLSFRARARDPSPCSPGHLIVHTSHQSRRPSPEK